MDDSKEEVTYSRDNAEMDVMKRKMNVSNPANEWDDIVNTIANIPCTKSIWSVLRRIILVTTVYFIWKERNDIMFNNGKKNAEETLKGIIDNIKLQFVGLTVKNSAQVRTVEVEWNVKFHFNK
nr:hypothetical protein [Tanacetum cinerariifolium]